MEAEYEIIGRHPTLIQFSITFFKSQEVNGEVLFFVFEREVHTRVTKNASNESEKYAFFTFERIF